jgi:hypothetical protein
VEHERTDAGFELLLLFAAAVILYPFKRFCYIVFVKRNFCKPFFAIFHNFLFLSMVNIRPVDSYPRHLKRKTKMHCLAEKEGQPDPCSGQRGKFAFFVEFALTRRHISDIINAVKNYENVCVKMYRYTLG